MHKRWIFFIVVGIILVAMVTEFRRGDLGLWSHVQFDLLKPETGTHYEPILTTSVVKEHKYKIFKKTVVYTKGVLLYIHTAILDLRFNGDIVRILALERRDAEIPDFVCRVPGNGTDVTLEVPAPKMFLDPTWPHWSHYFAVGFDCHLPRNTRPKNVEFTSQDKAITFKIPVEVPVHYSHRKPLGICVKPVSGNLDIARLVEWFEINRLVGMEDFIIYVSDVRGPVQFVLNYYSDIVTEVPFAYLVSILQIIDTDKNAMTPEIRYAAYQQIYLVALHDCLFRFHTMYENILFIDIDEVLLPVRNETLPEMIRYVRSTYQRGAGFMFLTAWHFEELSPKEKEASPPFLYMQRHPVATLPIENQPKSIIATDLALSVNFHSILNVPAAHYSNEIMPWKTLGYIHHYRGTCKDKFEPDRCKELLQETRTDPVFPKYKKKLASNVESVMDVLQMH